MARSRKSRSDEAILLALACGATLENAARAADVSLSTVKRRMREAAFKQRLDDLRADMVQRTCGMLTAGSLEAVRTLQALHSSAASSPSVRLGAAKAMLEYGVKVREITELQQRMGVLEQQLSELRGEKGS